MNWQPIETAPIDRSILGFHPFSDGGGRIIIMIWNGDGTKWRSDTHSYLSWQPTYWMPLPAPPSAEETK